MGWLSASLRRRAGRLVAPLEDFGKHGPMFRTATNVTADMAGAAVIGRKQRAAGTAPVAAAHEPGP